MTGLKTPNIIIQTGFTSKILDSTSETKKKGDIFPCKLEITTM